jgi:hypothetical protein
LACYLSKQTENLIKTTTGVRKHQTHAYREVIGNDLEAPIGQRLEGDLERVPNHAAECS